MKIFILVVKLLFLGALFIVSNQNLHLADSNEREVFFDLYSSWANNVLGGGVELTGYVVKFEWLPPKEADDIKSLKSNYNFFDNG